MSNIQKYSEIFNYLSAPELPTEAHPTVVFGRQDPLVAQAAGNLIVANLADTLVITGGIGKDTGSIRKQGFRTEADYLNQQLQDDAEQRGYDLSTVRVLLERKAKTGNQNARNSVRLLQSSERLDRLTAVAHAVSIAKHGPIAPLLMEI